MANGEAGGGQAGLDVRLRITGEVRSDGPVRVLAGGSVEGGVVGREVVVLGRVRGRVQGVRGVEVRAGGELLGDVTGGSLLAEAGAVFRGRCRIGFGSVPSGKIDEPEEVARLETRDQAWFWHGKREKEGL